MHCGAAQYALLGKPTFECTDGAVYVNYFGEILNQTQCYFWTSLAQITNCTFLIVKATPFKMYNGRH